MATSRLGGADAKQWRHYPDGVTGAPELIVPTEAAAGAGAARAGAPAGFGTPAACSRGCTKPGVSAVSASGRWTSASGSLSLRPRAVDLSFVPTEAAAGAGAARAGAPVGFWNPRGELARLY